MSETERPRLKWARSQRFKLSPSGLTAIDAWKLTLSTVRNEGKTAFDAARASWAKAAGVEPDDAAVLAELGGEPAKRLDDVVKALEDTGTSREQIKDALERLYTAALVDPLVG